MKGTGNRRMKGFQFGTLKDIVRRLRPQYRQIRRSRMIHAYVLIEAEPTRVQELIVELRDMELDGSVIKQVHVVTGRYDMIAYVESPNLESLGN